MIEVVYRIGEGPQDAEGRPETAAQARALLEQGNDALVALLSEPRSASGAEPGTEGPARRVIEVGAGGFGLSSPAEGALRHAPFAAVLGCADARVPIELILGRAFNDLFVLRVAGNVLAQEIIGSIDYAIGNLPSMRLAVVLGHTKCGAVTAAVHAYLDPAQYLGLSAEHQLRSIVDHLFPAVRLGHAALLEVAGADAATQPGFAGALVEISAVLNAAIQAASLRSELASYDVEVVQPVYAVYDLTSHRIGTPVAIDPAAPAARLADPPATAEGFASLARDLAASPEVSALLAAG